MRVTVTRSLTLLSALAIAPGIARGEGSAELGVHHLLPQTKLRVDIRQFTTELIEWSGSGSITAWHPNGALMGTFTSPASIRPTMDGAYELMVDEEQAAWDLHVLRGSVIRPGRVSSRAWYLRPVPAWSDTDLRLYAKVPGGAGEDAAVVTFDFQGLAPRKIFSFRANQIGMGLPYSNRSAPPQAGVGPEEHPIYLVTPEGVNGTITTPVISNVGIEPNTCTSLVAGASKVRVGFDSNVEGAWHMVCDLNRDGVYDVSGGGDVVRTGRASFGHNVAAWDGLDVNGVAVAAGTVSCKVSLTVGTTFLGAQNVNTFYPGMRWYGPSNAPMRMFWDDSAVQSMDVRMRNGEFGLATSGPIGVMPGPISDGAIANVDARSFGNFGGRGKGSETNLQTFSWLRASQSEEVAVGIAASDGDRDGDNLLDSLECNLGTNPDDRDTDQDGIGDFVETDGGLPTDTDGDGMIDAVDTDSDNDTLLDSEDGPGDLDVDGKANYRDTDDDGDNVATAIERSIGTNPLDRDSDGDGINDAIETDGGLAIDSDLDEMLDALETDSDNDTLLDGVEGTSDFDGDGIKNWRDPDDDGDGIDTLIEARDGATFGNDVDGDGDPNWYDRNSDGDHNSDATEGTADDDGDGIPNYLDPDRTIRDGDGDGLADDVEVTLGTDPQDPDTDNDGINDGDEISRAGSPTRYEPRADTNPLDADTDDDGIADGEEIVAGSDTLVTDPLKPDTDGDGLQDGTETGVTTGVPAGRSDGTNIPYEGTGPSFRPDADPATETDPTDADTDDGTVKDGTEDTNRNGKIDGGERDPNVGADDIPPLCGNGRPDEGETCDDKNSVDGDGCSATCVVEPGFECHGLKCAKADTDDDGIPDETDNCAKVPNRSQSDRDRDGIGNVCDADQDGDGFPDVVQIVGGGCRCTSGSENGIVGLGILGLLVWVVRRRRV
ncbi:MAG: thrombospondin type 3 repeat-containing protein [Deltaproteobacteria bacterium]|nr:thrombospondin type 3 repeat-containing protein [Deltaproteobacteria bacterium]